jgi:hypothetical protein
MPEPDADDPRRSFDLVSGAMEVSCYGSHASHALGLGRCGGGDPDLLGTRATERAGVPAVDEWLEHDLRFPSGATGSMRCSMTYPRFEMTLRVEGSRGEVIVQDLVVQARENDRVVILTQEGTPTEGRDTRSSYIYQLEAFISPLGGGPPMPTGPATTPRPPHS